MTRQQVQSNLTQVIYTKKDTIIYCSIRLGKTKIALDAIGIDEKVLWIYPLNSMMEGYEQDIKKFKPLSSNITFVTTTSLKKIKDLDWDYIVVDEPQTLSMAQIKTLQKFNYKKRIGLSGTLSKKTLDRLIDNLSWYVGAKYTLEDAIKDEIVKDYKVFLHMIDLDNSKKCIPYKKFGKEVYGTEKEAYQSFTDTMEYFEDIEATEKLNNNKSGAFKAHMGFMKYMGLRTNLLYNAQSLFNYADSLVNSYKKQKALIYTLRTSIADSLSDQSFHTKNKEEEVLNWFKDSKDGHLAVVDCVTTGITIKNLNTVIFHSYDSNMENFEQKFGRSLLFELEGQQSNVHVCVLKDTQNEKWIRKACSALNQDKIFFIEKGKTYSKMEWIRKQYPNKELFEVIESGSIVYYAGTNEDGYKTYSFIGNPEKTYGFSSKKLQAI
jgi:superfamily II DNA or RNA helicase